MVFDGLFVHFVMCSSCQMEFARPPHNFALSLFHSLCHTQICAVVPSVRLVFAPPPLLFYYPTFPLLLFRPNGDNEVCCSKCQYIEWATEYFTITIHIAFSESIVSFTHKIFQFQFTSANQIKCHHTTYAGAI